MKTLRMIGMALFAVLLCMNFAACNNDDNSEVLEQDLEYVTVGLNCTGEFLTLRETPINTRANESVQEIQDVYAIKVYEVGEDNTETGYAYGVFTSLNDVKINLVAGRKYNFRTSIQIGNNNFNKPIGSEFVYTTDIDILNFEALGLIDPLLSTFQSDRYYGAINNYVPEQNGTIEIETKRIVYGANFIATGLSEGELNVVVSKRDRDFYSVELTEENPQSNEIYTFQQIREAWQQYENYTSTKRLYITWTKDDNSVIPLGIYEVTFKRNVKTTIKINLENIGFNNTLSITKEESDLSDDENEYIIEGGEIEESPVTKN